MLLFTVQTIQKYRETAGDALKMYHLMYCLSHKNVQVFKITVLNLNFSERDILTF